jgi:nucleotide-binding universal stress UspA family protein
VALEILKVCAERDGHLIALSTHGRSGPTRWVLGSVTEKVLRSSSVPVLVVRGKTSA